MIKQNNQFIDELIDLNTQKIIKVIEINNACYFIKKENYLKQVIKKSATSNR